ncbi:hypothetical protein KAR91_12765 [Candidatus Pacearchaeota archaeon]|nr:hypothetical protein [Candidatus Pacearchaeota archaeon]
MNDLIRIERIVSYRETLEENIEHAQRHERICRKEMRKEDERMWIGFADGLKKAYHLSRKLL